jgi:hypothetical protein
VSHPFTREDLRSDMKERLDALLTSRMQAHREMNDSTANDDTTTAKLRGRIAECKELLALLNPAPANGEDGSE